MARPLVIAYHLIWTAYGTWLPNDPRGSTSRTVASDRIAELGERHYGRRDTQPAGHVLRAFYTQAGNVLKYPLLTLAPSQFPVVAAALADVIFQRRYTCYACAVLPDHVHMVIRKHRDKGEDMIEHLQQASRMRLQESGHGSADHPIWTQGGWYGFLDRPQAVRVRIRYIEQNPSKAGLPAQRWPFVKDYDGWPLHPGHDPNSPYARRLRGQ
jgi:REP element-mobilizing transposase RayT